MLLKLSRCCDLNLLKNHNFMVVFAGVNFIKLLLTDTEIWFEVSEGNNISKCTLTPVLQVGIYHACMNSYSFIDIIDIVLNDY